MAKTVNANPMTMARAGSMRSNLKATEAAEPREQVGQVLHADEFGPDRNNLQHDRHGTPQALGLAIALASALTKKARLIQPGFSDSRT
ncbi:hypothetical protein [Bradyrhizobium iriomotense]|uniref:hypothetical protein n=1 Tax=Bradyrhizobium iriomotense TaxID=441950 RepID=UPI0024E0B521|nr:hypothetical protein [Bradyrhizobium iriomotense]